MHWSSKLGWHVHPKREENPKAKCPKATRGDVRLLLKAAWAQGAWIELGGNDHYKVFPANGDKMVPIPQTPSSYRTIKNKRSQLRRVGIDPSFNKKRK